MKLDDNNFKNKINISDEIKELLCKIDSLYEWIIKQYDHPKYSTTSIY